MDPSCKKQEEGIELVLEEERDTKIEVNRLNKERASPFVCISDCALKSIRRCFCPCLPRRYVLALMFFLGAITFMPLRVNLGVTIVAMTDNRTGGVDTQNTTLEATTKRYFKWSPELQGFLLSAFVYGYVVLQIPAGYLASKYGGHLMLGLGPLLTALLALLTPVGAYAHAYILIAIRFCQGLSQGFTTTVIPTLLRNWAPPNERSTLATLAMAGLNGGVTIGIASSGILTTMLGWESVFYIQGAICMVWCILWFLLVSESPDVDPSISKKELTYILKQFGEGEQTPNRSASNVPWRKIFTSCPFWALLVTHASYSWGVVFQATLLPSYLNRVLKFDVKTASLITSLPFLIQIMAGPASGLLSDKLSKKYLSVTSVRKIFNAIGQCMLAVVFIVTSFTTSKSLAVAVIVIGIGFGSLALPCVQGNSLDIAPRHSSLIMGITNSCGTLIGAFSPIFVGFTVQEDTQEAWRTVFLVTAGIYLLGVIAFSAFGSGREQSWYGIELESQEDSLI